MLKKLFSLAVCLALCVGLCFSTSANEQLSVSDYVNTPAWAQFAQTAVDASKLNLGGKSIMLVEETTGTVLYERDADVKMPPASITKIMTLLLTMEAIEDGKFSLDTIATCSAHAASMGGSQIWLKEGEQMSVDDIVKAVCIKSANDAAVVLAEMVGGSEEVFVSMMNERAKQLKMTNTTFKNASGLDAVGHLSTARDISIMSRELMRHPKIFEYTKIWMDTLRGGTTELVNTNKLIRFYKGATGLKTGTTNGAGSCVSATAERDGLSLIAVVMGFPNSDTRNAAAKKLLDFGFANYQILKPEISEDIPKQIKVAGAVCESVKIKSAEPPRILTKKGGENKIETRVTTPKVLKAPITEGQKIGHAEIFLNGEPSGRYDILAAETAQELDFSRAFLDILRSIF